MWYLIYNNFWNKTCHKFICYRIAPPIFWQVNCLAPFLKICELKTQKLKFWSCIIWVLFFNLIKSGYPPFNIIDPETKIINDVNFFKKLCGYTSICPKTLNFRLKNWKNIKYMFILWKILLLKCSMHIESTHLLNSCSNCCFILMKNIIYDVSTKNIGSNIAPEM